MTDPREVEVELGYFNFAHTGGANTTTTPGVVLNYGVVKNLELVGEFHVDVSPGVDVTDPALSLKGVVKEGVLQDKRGLSVAVEAGLLLPSTVTGERGVGFETVGIVSGKLAPVIVHVNGGGGLDRGGRLFGVWGVIGEVAVHEKARVVGGVNGESVEGLPPNNSALIGVIWQPTSGTCFSMPAYVAGSASRRPTGNSPLA